MKCWQTGEEIRSLKDYCELGKKMEFIESLNMAQACAEGERLRLDRYPLDRYLEITPADYEDSQEDLAKFKEDSGYYQDQWIRSVQVALLEELSILKGHG